MNKSDNSMENNQTSSLFTDIPRVYGDLLTPEQKTELREKGKKFYDTIDFDLYKPVIEEKNPMGDFVSLSSLDETETLAQKVLWKQLQIAIRSGLNEDDFTEEEKELLKRIKV